MTQSTDRVKDDDAVVDAASLEPTQAEIDDWAARERHRREEWLKGPTDEERAAYARRIKQRRLAETFEEGEARLAESLRMGVHYTRETQLAAEGAIALMIRMTRRTFADLVQAGREWEEETSLPVRRRRVTIDDETS